MNFGIEPNRSKQLHTSPRIWVTWYLWLFAALGGGVFRTEHPEVDSNRVFFRAEARPGANPVFPGALLAENANHANSED